MFPRKQVGEAAGADVFADAEGLQETVAEEFDHGGAAVGWHAVEAALGVEQSVGGKDVEVRMEEEVIAEGVDSGHSGEAANPVQLRNSNRRWTQMNTDQIKNLFICVYLRSSAVKTLFSSCLIEQYWASRPFPSSFVKSWGRK